MAKNQQDVVENINRIVKKKTDTDRSLGDATPRKPIGSQRGMAWVNSTGGVSTASAGGSSSGSGGSSGGPTNTGGTGGTGTGIPLDADGSISYGGGGGGSSVTYDDPTNPDAVTDSIPGDPLNPVIPPGGTEAGSGDLTGDEAMSGLPGGVEGPITGFGTSLDGFKNGYYCPAEGGSVKIRLGLDPLPVPPDGWEPDGEGGYIAPADPTWTEGHYYVFGAGQAFGYTESNFLEAVGNYYSQPSSNYYLDYNPSGADGLVRVVGTDQGIGLFEILICNGSQEAYCTVTADDVRIQEYEADGVCNMALIDGMWVPDPLDPDCEGLTPQRCYLVSNSCPTPPALPSGTMFCVLSDGGVAASEWENGGPKIDGITKIFHKNATGTGYTMSAATSNSQRDDYLYK